MKRFVILGAGRQGSACAAFLLERFEDAAIDFVDNRADHLRAAAGLQRHSSRVVCHELGASPVGDALARLMANAACVVSCVPFFFNTELTAAALDAGAPCCDLGGNVETVAAQLAMADACRQAGVVVAPDCGLAPGLLNILAEYWSGDWEYESVRLYCGGLPQNPRGRFKFALTFSAYGLLNEYLETIESLSEVERLTDLAVPGEFEAFATSGGASRGAELYAAKGVDYQYKTIRYPGHRDVVCAMREMSFFDTTPRRFNFDGQIVETTARQISSQIMEQSLKPQGKDLVVARADVVGKQDGRQVRGRIDLIDYAVDRFTAMERTTGFPTAVTAAALAGMYEQKIAPGAYVPFEIIDPRLMMKELARAGLTGITVREL